MLVLTRKNQEEIQIGDAIKVTILKVKGKTVKIGIDAPREFRVRRSELIAKDLRAAEAGLSCESGGDQQAVTVEEAGVPALREEAPAEDSETCMFCYAI